MPYINEISYSFWGHPGSSVALESNIEDVDCQDLQYEIIVLINLNQKLHAVAQVEIINKLGTRKKKSFPPPNL